MTSLKVRIHHGTLMGHDNKSPGKAGILISCQKRDFVLL